MALAYEWGCLPDEIERLDDRTVATMQRYLRWRAVMERKAREGR